MELEADRPNYLGVVNIYWLTLCMPMETECIEPGLNKFFKHILPVHYIHDTSKQAIAEEGHCGEHVGNVLAVIICDQFKVFAADLKQKLDIHFEKKKEEFSIVFSCAFGVHKSVGWALCIFEMLSDTYEVRIQHLSKDRWKMLDKSLCDSCMECKGVCECKDGLKDDLLDIWHEMV